MWRWLLFAVVISIFLVHFFSTISFVCQLHPFCHSRTLLSLLSPVPSQGTLMLLQPLAAAESCSDWSFFRTQEHKELNIKSRQPRRVKLSHLKSKNQFSNFFISKEACWNVHFPMLSPSSVCLKLHHCAKDSQKMLRRLCTDVPHRKKKNHFCVSGVLFTFTLK